MDQNLCVFRTETDMKPHKRSKSITVLTALGIGAALICLGLFVSPIIAFFGCMIAFSSIVFLFMKDQSQHTYELRFEEKVLYITDKTDKKTYKLSNLSSDSFFIAKRSKYEINNNLGTLVVNDTSFILPYLKNFEELKEYIAKNF